MEPAVHAWKEGTIQDEGRINEDDKRDEDENENEGSTGDEKNISKALHSNVTSAGISRK